MSLAGTRRLPRSEELSARTKVSLRHALSRVATPTFADCPGAGASGSAARSFVAGRVRSGAQEAPMIDLKKRLTSKAVAVTDPVRSRVAARVRDRLERALTADSPHAQTFSNFG